MVTTIMPILMPIMSPRQNCSVERKSNYLTKIFIVYELE